MSASKEPPLTEDLRTRLGDLNANSSVEEWKAVGNDCFAQGCHLSAIRCYTKALSLEPDSAVIHSNRSAAYLKSTMFAGPSLALKDAERAVQLSPGWYKAHLRVADAQFSRKKYEEAKASYQKVLELNSSCSSAKESLRLVEQELFLRSLDEQEKKQRLDEVNGNTGSGESKGDSLSWSHNSKTCGNNVTASSASSTSCSREVLDETDIERHIRLWTQDTVLCEERTAMRKFNACLDEADREAGAAYKKDLLEKFRNRLESNGVMRARLEERRDHQMRLGEHVDYRNPEKHRAVLMQGTDGVGLGISTDAYKSYRYESTMW
uniref:Uncharacterized protein n=1 Tax=Trypanosoma congolense (strain IL3000) TaxID=1068625 RepID=G0UWN1_TRYCI|nr:conserved hypothetical protein [Trypanosoma congolense IL3000]